MINIVRRSLPEIVNGYELGKQRGFISVIIPLERTNLITNPSFETSLTGYTSVDGATLTRTTEDQRRGAFSLKVKPGLSLVSGIYYTTSSLTSGSIYAFSLDVNVRGGRKYTISIFDGIRTIVQKKIVGKGFWERISIVGVVQTTGAHRLYLQKDNTSDTDEIFTDGWQLELCDTSLPSDGGSGYATTYIDGDQLGFLPNQIAYYWTGVEHASTSVRIGQTRSGGKIVNLKEYGFRLLSIIGLGFAPVANTLMPFGLLDGSMFQRTSIESRQFTLAGQIDGSSLIDLHNKRRLIEDAIQPDSVGIRQPLRLVYQAINDCGDPIGHSIDIDCVLSGGPNGITDNFHQEKLALQFTTLDPFIVNDGERAKTLNFSSDVPASWIVKRNSAGVWSAPPSGADGPIIALGADGALYASGGTAVTRLVGSTWTTIGNATGGGPLITAMAVGLDNKLYVGGNFTAIGGVSSPGIIRYDPTLGTWQSISSAFTGTSILGIAFDSNNTLYVGGAFSAISGITVTGLARRNNTSGIWSIVGSTGLNGGSQVDDIIFGLDGLMYITGSFSTVNAVTASRIAKYNISTNTWSALSTGLNNGGTSLAAGINGLIYVSGNFTAAGGVTAAGIASWNGVSFSPLGSGINGSAGDMVVDQNGILYIVGSFTTAGGVSVLSGFARWNGSKWDISDIALPAAAVHLIIDSSTGDIYIGYNSPIGSATAAAVTSVRNQGQSIAYPIIEFYGSGRVYQVVNYTTGRSLFFNLLLLANEKVTLITKPGKVSFVSNLRGSLFSTITGLDNLALTPGSNNISALMAGTDGNAKVIMRWHETYQSIAATLYNSGH